jgi:HEAT repeat protein
LARFLIPKSGAAPSTAPIPNRDPSSVIVPKVSKSTPVPSSVVVPPPDDRVATPPPPRDIVAELEDLIKASKDPDATVRARAAAGLGTFLGRANDELRRKAAKALAELGADAEPALVALRVAVTDGDAEVRKAASEALEKLDAAKTAKDHETILALAKDLKAKEPAKRLKALEQVATYGSKANVVGEQLIEAMTDKVADVQDAAALTLEKVNPAVFRPVFTLLRGMAKIKACLELGQLKGQAEIAIPLLLHYQNNQSALGIFLGTDSFGYDLFPIIAKIAPKDKRFADAVLTHIATTPPDEYAQRRMAGIAQLKIIDAKAADKVKALITAIGDGRLSLEVIAALRELGKDAEPALPSLKKLKLSPDDEIRKAASEAINKIE